MAQQTINVGAAPNDGTGTPLRTAFQYTNSNFSELYTAVGPSGNNIVVPGNATITGDLTVDTNVLKVDSTNNRVGIGTATPANTLEVVAPSGDNIVSTFRSGDATAANNAGGGFRSISSATAASRVAQVWLDADGANFSGGDYFFIQKNGGSGTVEFNQSSNAAMVFLTNSTERMRLDSSGNLGLGVTPSAWGSSYKAIQVASRATLAQTPSVETIVGNNWYADTSSTNRYLATAASSIYLQGAGAHAWLTAPSGTAGNAITFTQAMTLDASGRLLVGTVTSGTAAGDGVIKLGTYGHCISQTGASIANGSSVDLTVATSFVGYQGFLSVANTLDGNANARTQTTFSVFGRGTSSTITQIATADGPTSGASFTVTTPSAGVIRITNTSGNVATISAQFFGGSSL